MGCDIHMYVEVKENGTWNKMGRVFKNYYYDPERETINHEDGYVFNAEYIDSPYRLRNYDLFSILANVRNGYGFAGCDTGDGFVPIDMPRGLPKDVSTDIQAESDSWNGDGHSHSWLSLGELLNYDWKSRSSIKRGFFSLDEYRAFRATKEISSYAGGVDGGRVIKIDQRQADKIIDNNLLTGNIQFYVQVEWIETYYESAKYFVDNVIPELEKLGDPDDVRIVFWFDN